MIKINNAAAPAQPGGDVGYDTWFAMSEGERSTKISSGAAASKPNAYSKERMISWKRASL